jgi:hypothetical protein
MFHHKKFTPFVKLSRHKKRDLYIRLITKIRKTTSGYGENFTSHLVLNEADRPSFFNQWFDFYFLGLDGVTIWNTALYTANQAYWDAIQDLAFEEAYRISPKTDDDFELDTFFIPVYDKVTGKKLHYTMKEPEIKPELDNRTLYQFVDDYSSKLICEDTGNTAPIFESFRTDTSYRYGVGLYAVMDVPSINAETIEAMITKFRSIGEQNWKNATSVDRSRLPGNTFEVMARNYIKT